MAKGYGRQGCLVRPIFTLPVEATQFSSIGRQDCAVERKWIFECVLSKQGKKMENLRRTTSAHAGCSGKSFEINSDLVFGKLDASSKKGVVGHGTAGSTVGFGDFRRHFDGVGC